MSTFGSVTLALSLIPGYWLAAVSAQDRYKGASQGFGPPLSSTSSSLPSLPPKSKPERLDDEESRLLEEPTIKKEADHRSMRSMLVFAVVLALAMWLSQMFNPIKDGLMTLIVSIVAAVVFIVATAEIFKTSGSSVCRTSAGRLFDPRTSNGGLTHPSPPQKTEPPAFTKNIQLLIFFSSFTIYPLLLLLQNTPLITPFISIATISFTFMISRVAPKRFSLLWVVLPVVGLELLLALIPIGIFIAADLPVGVGFRIWVKERAPEEWAAHTPGGTAAVEKMTKGWFEERRLGAEAQFYRFLLLGVVGWIVTGLYRLDVRLREGKSGELRLEAEEGKLEGVEEDVKDASRSEPSNEVGPAVITAGHPIAIPSLRYSLPQHSLQALESLPVYFATSLSVVVALLLFLPPLMSLVDGHPYPDGALSTGPVSSSATEMLAVLLSPPLMALAITVVSICRGELKEVWMYKEVWGGVKPALLSAEDGAGEKRDVAGGDDDASVEALLSEKQGLLF